MFVDETQTNAVPHSVEIIRRREKTRAQNVSRRESKDVGLGSRHTTRSSPPSGKWSSYSTIPFRGSHCCLILAMLLITTTTIESITHTSSHAPLHNTQHHHCHDDTSPHCFIARSYLFYPNCACTAHRTLRTPFTGWCGIPSNHRTLKTPTPMSQYNSPHHYQPTP